MDKQFQLQKYKDLLEKAEKVATSNEPNAVYARVTAYDLDQKVIGSVEEMIYSKGMSEELALAMIDWLDGINTEQVYIDVKAY